MTIEHRVRPAAADPSGLLALFHGRGTDEHDLFPLPDLLDPERRLLGVTPRGPLSLPPGGAHWYAVREIGYPIRRRFYPPSMTSPNGSTPSPTRRASARSRRCSAGSRRAR